MFSVSLKNAIVHNSIKSLMMETNFQKERQFIAFRVQIVRRNCKYLSLFVCPCKLHRMSVRTRTGLFKAGLR